MHEMPEEVIQEQLYGILCQSIYVNPRKEHPELQIDQYAAYRTFEVDRSLYGQDADIDGVILEVTPDYSRCFAKTNSSDDCVHIHIYAAASAPYRPFATKQVARNTTLLSPQQVRQYPKEAENT